MSSWPSFDGFYVLAKLKSKVFFRALTQAIQSNPPNHVSRPAAYPRFPANSSR